MSGHSKWSTIKRQKEATDKARGKLFSKLSRAIQVAVRSGGVDPSVNLPLRLAIDKARQANMPKENIDRALRQVQGKLGGELEEVTYEGYGPYGIAVLVETATDNRNRTTQEVKNLFERGGGSLGGPGAVSFQFKKKGLVVVEKGKNAQELMLSLIDEGVPELEEADDGIEIYVPAKQLSAWQEKLESAGFKVKQAELVYKPSVYVNIHDRTEAEKVLKFLDSLYGHDDVQKVFANVDIEQEALRKTAER